MDHAAVAHGGTRRPSRTRTRLAGASVANAIVVSVPPVRAARRHSATVVIAATAVCIGIVVIAVGTERTAVAEVSDMASVTATDVPAIHRGARPRSTEGPAPRLDAAAARAPTTDGGAPSSSTAKPSSTSTSTPTSTMPPLLGYHRLKGSRQRQSGDACHSRRHPTCSFHSDLQAFRSFALGSSKEPPRRFPSGTPLPFTGTSQRSERALAAPALRIPGAAFCVAARVPCHADERPAHVPLRPGHTHQARLSNAALAGVRGADRAAGPRQSLACSFIASGARDPRLGFQYLLSRRDPHGQVPLLRAGSPTGIEIKSQHPASMP